MKCVLRLLPVFLFFFRAHTASSATPGVSPTEVLLGQSAAFTGSSGALGTEFWRGAEAYFDAFNAAGGAHGRKIKLTSLDDKYEGDLALPNTLKLITDTKVFALFGYVGTPTLVKALPAIQRYSSEGIFLFSDFTGAQPQREPPHVKYVINVRPSYRQETKGLVDHLAQLGFHRFGIFIQDDAYGRSGADGVQRALKSKGMALLKEVTYIRGSPLTTPMTDQVALLMKAGVDAVISVSTASAAAAFVRDARSAGFKGPIAHVSFVNSDALLERLLTEGERIHTDLTKKIVNSQVVPLPDDEKVPLVKEYLAAMKKWNPQLPPGLGDPDYRPRDHGFVSLEGYISAKLFVEILKRVPEPLTRAAFMNRAEHLGALDLGLNEKLSLSAADHQALDSIFYTTIENGKYVTLKSWEALR
ncbi:MAG: ABC transporter substrate-binding protein [Bdellovibrionota bacterium]